MNAFERINRVRGHRAYLFSTSAIQAILVGLLFGFGIPILIDSKESDDSHSNTRVWLYCIIFFVIAGLAVLKDILEYIICRKYKNDDPESKSESTGSLIWALFAFCVMCWGLNILRILNTNEDKESSYRDSYPDLLILFHVIIYYQVALICLIALFLIIAICIGCCMASTA